MSTLNGGPGNIVTNGLVLYLDAANRDSYVSGSTTWRDLSGNNNNGTLINGPTFSSSNAGSIVFDGVDDHVSLGTDFGSINNSNFSFGVFFYWNGVNINGALLGKRNASPFNQYNIGVRAGPNNVNIGNVLSVFLLPDAGIGTILQSELSYTLPSAGWYYGFVNVSELSQQLFVNGILRQSTSRNWTGQTFNITGRNFYVGAITSNSNTPQNFWNDKISQCCLYNRALSAEEILQNYNSTKARFGL